MQRSVLVLIIASVGALLVDPASGRASAVLRRPHIEVELLADRSAVTPGGRMQLAVRFRIEDDWHIYWTRAGEPGAPALPTVVELTTPKGFTVAGPHFPAPHRKKTVDGDVFALEGEPVVLFDVTAPAGAASETVTFDVKTSWLICKKQCIPGRGELSLSLPVASASAPPQSRNAELFESARDELPLPQDKAGRIKLSGRASRAPVRPGDTFELKLDVEIKPGHHIQSHNPPNDALIATDLFVEPVEGLAIGKPTFPPGKARTDKYFGKVSEYAGTVAVTIPVEAQKDLPRRPLRVNGVLRYQACTDKGTCFPPEEVRFSIKVPIAVASADKTSRADEVTGESAVVHSANPDFVPQAPGGQDDGADDVAVAATQAGPSETGGIAGSINAVQEWFAARGILGYLAMAFLGGLVLNFMPCVLPVISLKVLSFVKQAEESRWRVLALGLTFSVGIVLSFLALGGLAFVLEIGWGGLFQRPQVTIALAAVVTAFALSLFGVFSLRPPQAVDQIGAKVSGEGYGSALGMGVLATLLGTACTAPFLSAVIAFAVTRESMAEGMAIFGVAGMGMAIPYVMLAANPGWLRFVPRAGPWMKNFEQAMGFVLLATVIWLLNPLPAQITGAGLIWALVFILAVAFVVWLFGKVEFGARPGKRARYYGAAGAVLALGWLIPFRWVNTIPELQAAADAARRGQYVTQDLQDGPLAKIPWRPYRRAEAQAHVEQGFTVFVDYTADWCPSCKWNEATSLNIDSTRDLMRKLNVVPFKADYTNPDSQIKADLRRLNRAGVPVYVVYSPFDWEAPRVLPELLTPGIVHDALRSAGPSQAKAAKTPVSTTRR